MYVCIIKKKYPKHGTEILFLLFPCRFCFHIQHSKKPDIRAFNHHVCEIKGVLKKETKKQLNNTPKKENGMFTNFHSPIYCSSIRGSSNDQNNFRYNAEIFQPKKMKKAKTI